MTLSFDYLLSLSSPTRNHPHPMDPDSRTRLCDPLPSLWFRCLGQPPTWSPCLWAKEFHFFLSPESSFWYVNLILLFPCRKLSNGFSFPLRINSKPSQHRYFCTLPLAIPQLLNALWCVHFNPQHSRKQTRYFWFKQQILSVALKIQVSLFPFLFQKPHGLQNLGYVLPGTIGKVCIRTSAVTLIKQPLSLKLLSSPV